MLKDFDPPVGVSAAALQAGDVPEIRVSSADGPHGGWRLNEAQADAGPVAPRKRFLSRAARIGAAIGRPLTFQPISDEEARQRYSRISGSAEETEAHVALWRAIREGRVETVNDNVERILGRKPIALDQWLVENAEAFR